MALCRLLAVCPDGGAKVIVGLVALVMEVAIHVDSSEVVRSGISPARMDSDYTHRLWLDGIFHGLPAPLHNQHPVCSDSTNH